MTRPNILWIVATQWRAQAAGYAGDPNARTPHVDALAARSVNFAQAVTPHPMGSFARAAMFTGVPCPQNGVRDYFDPLPEIVRTIAHELGTCGFATAFFGKWHLAKRDPRAPLVGEAHARTIVPPARRGGFEFWEGFESGFLLNDPWLHGTALPEPKRFSGYQSDILASRFALWLETRKKSQPIFAVVSFEAPHPPYDAPAADVPLRDPATLVLASNVPRGNELETRARRELAGYYSHLEATDRAIGRLLAHADGNWIVVFTSVHGDMHGAHGLFRKAWPHEESVRVPLLVRIPRQTARVDQSAASLLDLPAMTRGWAEGEARSSAPQHARISMPSIVAVPHQCDRTWRGVRSRTRKLVLNADGSPWLFFDLERDPLEMNNLIGDATRAQEIAELARMV